MSSSPVTIKGADHSKKEIHVQNTWQHSDAHHALLGKVANNNTPGSGSGPDSNNNFPVPPDSSFVSTEKRGFSSARLGDRARILDNSNRDGNVIFIVRAVIQVDKVQRPPTDDEIKKDDNVGYVLIQESKKQRNVYETWNLPAGNVNRGESIEEAMRRIIEEEAGLQGCNIERIIQVEELGPYWFRFTYHVTFDERYHIENHLKQKPDVHSLQARVWRLKELQGELFPQLRDEGILGILKDFRNQCNRRQEVLMNPQLFKSSRAPYQFEDQCMNPLNLNVTPLPQEHITIRAVFLYRHDVQREYKDDYRDKYSHNSRTSTVNQRQSVNNSRQTRPVEHQIGTKLWTLCRKSRSGNRCPIIPCWPAMAKKCCQSEIYVFLTYIHDTDTIHRFSFIPLGITQIEHCKMQAGNSSQGLRLTIVYRLNQAMGPQSNSAESMSIPPKLKPNVEYAWEQLDDEQAKGYLNDHTRSNGTLLTPLKSLRLSKIGHDREPNRRDEMSLDTWENTLHRYGIKK